MDEYRILAEERTLIGKKVKLLRQEGKLPAIIYGKGVEPLTISLDERSATRILNSVTSSNLIVLEVEGKDHTTLVREKQIHPVNDRILHVDFLEVSLTERIKASVTVTTQGESPAVKNYGALIVTGLDSLDVECLPQNLPERIVVDISVLEEIGDTINVGDVILPEEVTVLTDSDETLLVATAPAAEEVVEEVEEVEEGEPEVIERGKLEEDLEEAEESSTAD